MKKSSLSPQVYISYTWRPADINETYNDRKADVMKFADRLRDAGIDSRIDQYFGDSLHGFVPRGRRKGDVWEPWNMWQKEQIDNADFVILFCTETYDLKSLPDESLTWAIWHSTSDTEKADRQKRNKSVPGTWWDFHFIVKRLEEGRASSSQFIPVGNGPYSLVSSHIPEFIKGENYYDLSTNGGFESLLRKMQGQHDQLHPTKSKVIFPLHGIRTHGRWQDALSDVATNWECRRAEWNFGWFSIFRFLSPWSREAKVRWFRKTYRDEVIRSKLELKEKDYPSVVAHSFGTYILGNALLKYKDIRFDKVVLCGSILPIDFPWDEIINRGQVQMVRNEYGVKDVWVHRVGWFVPQTGRSGIEGFNRTHERVFNEEFYFDHGEYFDKGHIENYWLPFLERRDLSHISWQKEKNVIRPVRTYPVIMYLIYFLFLVLIGWIIINVVI